MGLSVRTALPPSIFSKNNTGKMMSKEQRIDQRHDSSSSPTAPRILSMSSAAYSTNLIHHYAQVSTAFNSFVLLSPALTYPSCYAYCLARYLNCITASDDTEVPLCPSI